MSATLSVPDGPPSPPQGLISAALATGAAVVAGAVLGRRSLPGIAAGLAAWAGAKWISSARRPAPFLRLEYGTPETDLSPEVYPPDTKMGPDWIDHHAVEFSHDVPDPIHARELLKDKVLPLLDDNGTPVHELCEAHIEVAAQPVAVAPHASDSVSDALIWEPTSGAQSCSHAACETVWFGLHEPIVIAAHEPPSAVPSLSPNHGAPPQLTPGEHLLQSPVAPDTLIPPPCFSSKRHGTPFAVPVKVATVPLQDVILPDVPASLELDLPGAPLSAAPHVSAAALITSPAAAGASVISPKPNTNSVLPTPRRQGALPKHLAAEPAAEHLSSVAEPLTAHILPEDTRAWLRELPIVPETAPTVAAIPQRRHLEPLAPMVAFRPPPRRWPLLVLLTLLLTSFLFLAADGWQHGELLRKIKGMSWIQKAAVIKDAVSSPSAVAPNPTSWTPSVAPQE
jgi:hypothetical protein